MTYIEVSIGRLWVGLNGLVGLKAHVLGSDSFGITLSVLRR